MLRQQFTDALKTAMLGKEEMAVATIRLMMARMKDLDIAARSKGVTDGIKDDEILSMMQGMIKQRRESIALYEKGNRPDLVKVESDEIAIIERFLPQQMDAAATDAAITSVIASTGAQGVKDMGKVMAELKAKYAGQMDFSQAGPLVKAKLA